MERILIILATTITFISISSVTFSETCPSAHLVKHNSYGAQWKAYDSRDQLIRKDQLPNVFQFADKLTLVEWSKSQGKTGDIRCYYQDKHGSHLEVYLANRHYTPVNTQHVWYQVTGHLHCAAGVSKCEFSTSPLYAKRKAIQHEIASQ